MRLMIVTCPNCSAKYRFSAMIRNAVLVCHHCGKEFELHDTQQQEPKPAATTPEKLPLFERSSRTIQSHKNEDRIEPKSNKPALQRPVEPIIPNPDARISREKITAPITTSKIVPKKKLTPQQQPVSVNKTKPKIAPAASNPEAHLPEIMQQRKKHRIWPWATLVLFMIGCTGIWQYQTQWLHNPWVIAANNWLTQQSGARLIPQIPSGIWRIDHQSVGLEWITREDHSKALMISGIIRNQLPVKRIPPVMTIGFADASRINKLPVDLHLPITVPPLLEEIRSVPYQPPATDTLPVAPHDQRSFLMLIETLPEYAEYLTLSVKSP